MSVPWQRGGQLPDNDAVGESPTMAAGVSPTGSRVVVGSVIKKRRKRMAKKKHRKLLKKTRVQRRNKK